MRRVSSRLALFAVLAFSVLGFTAVGAVAKTHVVKPKNKLVVITGGTTTIKATSATAMFLAKHKVAVTAVKPATLTGTSVTLPVKGGVAKAKNLFGVVLHRGAITFTVGTKSLVVRDLTLYKFGKQAHLAALVRGHVVRLGNITGLKAAISGKTATLTGELHLTAAVAALINKLVGHHVVSAGYDFGSFISSLTIK